MSIGLQTIRPPDWTASASDDGARLVVSVWVGWVEVNMIALSLVQNFSGSHSDSISVIYLSYLFPVYCLKEWGNY